MSQKVNILHFVVFVFLSNYSNIIIGNITPFLNYSAHICKMRMKVVNLKNRTSLGLPVMEY